jgi:hypothetical protein
MVQRAACNNAACIRGWRGGSNGLSDQALRWLRPTPPHLVAQPVHLLARRPQVVPLRQKGVERAVLAALRIRHGGHHLPHDLLLQRHALQQLLEGPQQHLHSLAAGAGRAAAAPAVHKPAQAGTPAQGAMWGGAEADEGRGGVQQPSTANARCLGACALGMAGAAGAGAAHLETPDDLEEGAAPWAPPAA